MAFRSSSQIAEMTKPKHMPHKPWRMVRMITRKMSPLFVTPKTTIMNRRTSAVCPHMTTNCVTTCEKRISNGVTPATHERSRRPSVRSIIKADDVNATAKKKTILIKKEFQIKIAQQSAKISTHVKITPGATKSVNDGSLVP